MAGSVARPFFHSQQTQPLSLIRSESPPPLDNSSGVVENGTNVPRRAPFPYERETVLPHELRIHLPPFLQHRHELLQAARPRLWLLRVLQAVQDRVAVAAAER